ncbi:OmpA/MotB family protein [Niveispirillum lacus]|uniref:OmpA/MotB family protein n=1 Tax=Niveispirillum lacus TaxID=1981099 RepID=UPI0013FE2333|nr:OmpA family protein [Niveispirillum lacus]
MAVEQERRNGAVGHYRDTDKVRNAARWSSNAGTRAGEPAEESEEWVISYMDMVTVLMTVFLGMLAIMGMDGRLAAPSAAERAAAAAVTEALQQDVPTQPVAPMPPVAQEGPAPAATTDANRVMPTLPAPVSLTPGNKQWLDRLAALGLPPDIDISATERKVTIVVRERILFASGSATLQPAAMELLRKLSPSLSELPGSITVEGHSDDLAISTIRFPSNWELSAARAAAVVRALAGMGIPPVRLAALGLSDSRPLTSDPARRAENRRVEIVVDTDVTTAHAATR